MTKITVRSVSSTQLVPIMNRLLYTYDLALIVEKRMTKLLKFFKGHIFFSLKFFPDVELSDIVVPFFKLLACHKTFLFNNYINYSFLNSVYVSE